MSHGEKDGIELWMMDHPRASALLVTPVPVAAIAAVLVFTGLLCSLF